jgi:DNA-directed RNA polymerase subunit L
MMIREFQTMEVQRCFKTNEKGEPNSFDFIVETIGTLPIAVIVEKALYNMEKRLSKYAGELPNDVKVMPADNRAKAFDFYFPNEDHTLGNLLQAYMEANQMDSNQISYVGYKVPHPLRAEMVLRVGVDFPQDKTRDGKQTVARAALSQAAAGCALMFRQWREDWNRALAGPIGTRNRESLRLNVGNARALEEAAARIQPTATAKAAPGAKRTPQKSAFYDKLRPTLEADPSRAVAAPPPPAGATPNYGAYAPGTPNYGAASPAYAPTSPAYPPGTPNYGAYAAPRSPE